MRIDKFEYQDNWIAVKEAARNTISRDGSGKYPDNAWKKKILLAEHSPIRLIQFRWRWTDLPYWVSVHFVRHKFGIEHFVSTQRSDRTGIYRDEKRQDAPVKHECQANAQAIINMSRKRLCGQAANETRLAMELLVDEIRGVEPVLASVCVPECVYRGFCPEFHCCGYVNTEDYQKQLKAYREAK